VPIVQMWMSCTSLNAVDAQDRTRHGFQTNAFSARTPPAECSGFAEKGHSWPRVRGRRSAKPMAEIKAPLCTRHSNVQKPLQGLPIFEIAITPKL